MKLAVGQGVLSKGQTPAPELTHASTVDENFLAMRSPQATGMEASKDQSKRVVPGKVCQESH